METLLEANAVAYVNHPRGVAVRGGSVIASSIYDWFQEDFGGSVTGVLAHLRKYARPDLTRELQHALDIDDYDWSLNDIAER